MHRLAHTREPLNNMPRFPGACCFISGINPGRNGMFSYREWSAARPSSRLHIPLSPARIQGDRNP